MVRAEPARADRWWLAVFVGWVAVGCCGGGIGRLAPRPASDYRARIRDLSHRAPIGSTAVASPPFVVIGDGQPEQVQDIAQGVVGWAVERLKCDFFARDPGKIVEIWVFRDARSYLEHTNALFSYRPSSQLGYFDPCQGLVAVNLGAGAGTVVHEMVHAFMAANFPAAPIWFNEGLASLFEQPIEVDGHIHGNVNWRLKGLQRAIHGGNCPPLANLMTESRSEFYAEPGSGTRYAVARYLLYYLQAQGLLPEYYRYFVRHHRRDPTGATSLLAVTGERDLSHLQREWKRFVMKLQYVRPKLDELAALPADA
jgi:hypothetical protein